MITFSNKGKEYFKGIMMKREKSKNLKLTMLAGLVFLSINGTANAAGGGISVCSVPVEMTQAWFETASNQSEYAGECTEVKGVSQFSGSAADEIALFGTEIEAAGTEIAEQIAANSAAEIEVITNGNAELIKTMVNVTNQKIKDGLAQDKMLLDMKMNYLTELEERELKASQSVMSMDDTEEEVLFILNELQNVGNGSDGAYNHAHEVIAAMKAKYDDDPEFMMPIRIKSAQSTSTEGEGCPEYDPVAHKAGTLNGACFYGVKATPGLKLGKYFEECSRVKSETLANIQTNLSQSAMKQKQSKSQAEYMSKAQTQQAEQIVQDKVKEQVATSCNVKEFGYKICGKDENGEQLTTEDYLTKVTENEIIPYGNVSSSNYLNPVSVGSTDGDIGDITDEELLAMRNKALGYQKLDGSDQPAVSVSSNTPPIVNTYRTSAQYYAAEDFVANIVNKEAVSGMNVTRTTTSNNAMFQSKFMGRAAVLSLAEASLREPIAERVGTEIGNAIKDGSLTRSGVDGEILKEDMNGAGKLDRLIFSVNKDYDKLSNDAKSAINGTGTSGLLTAPPGALVQWQIQALIKNNELTLKGLEDDEKIELLLAALLATLTNSEENISYINSLK